MYLRFLLFRLRKRWRRIATGSITVAVLVVAILAAPHFHSGTAEYRLTVTMQPGWTAYSVDVYSESRQLLQQQGLPLSAYHFYLKPGDYIVNSLVTRGVDHVPEPGVPVRIHLDHDMQIVLYGD